MYVVGLWFLMDIHIYIYDLIKVYYFLSWNDCLHFIAELKPKQY